jgi:hypothetical protein
LVKIDAAVLDAILAPELAGVGPEAPPPNKLLVWGFAPPNKPVPAPALDVEVAVPPKRPVPELLGVAFAGPPNMLLLVGAPDAPPNRLLVAGPAGGGPAGVVEPPKLKVFDGAGVVDPAGAPVAAVFGERPPPNVEGAGVFRAPKSPPVAGAVVPVLLKTEGADVLGAAGFAAKGFTAALPVLPVPKGVDVLEPGFEAAFPLNIELGCADPVLAPKLPKDGALEVVAPPNIEGVPELGVPEFAVPPNNPPVFPPPAPAPELGAPPNTEEAPVVVPIPLKRG